MSPPDASNGRPIDEARQTVSQAAAIADLERQIADLHSRCDRFMWAISALSSTKSLVFLEEKGRQRLTTHLPTGEKERIVNSNAASSYEAALVIARDTR